ncbi:hypothetical protein [Flavobacterium sp.]|uniref:hypothetical protein n=2 Tax=Flavobacterium sp. TaxID=239 RepID=UPI004047CFC6
MASIKIQNFGPITKGYEENDGFINIDKVMVFIGGQGSGKSSVVKLISTLSWLEKGLFKRSIVKADIVEDNAFQEKWCEYQSIHNYFKKNTYIEYKGEYLHFRYKNQSITLEENLKSNYELPKITYIPAERNFLSVLEDLESVKGLPKSLQWTLDEHIRACRSQKTPIPIGINDITFEYNRETKIAYIKGNGFENLRLSEASSGIQSVVPMVNVMYYLQFFINNNKLNSIEKLSFFERERFEELERELFKSSKLPSSEREKKRTKLKGRFLPQYLFTIIEEMEQNLFPESQKNILFNSLIIVNEKEKNHLILTTHSPYVIAYLSLAMKADKIKKNVKDELLSEKLNEIVPLKSTINSDNTGAYQIDDNGKIVSIISKRGLVIDNNYLNNSLDLTNELFNDLLDIEELCQ